jgi:hypothetical protein
MRRSRARKPQLSLTRTYAAKFLEVKWHEFSLREIRNMSLPELRNIRVAVYSLAADLLTTAGKGKCDAHAEIEPDGNLTLKISVNDKFPDVDCIRARSLERATQQMDKAFKSFYKRNWSGTSDQVCDYAAAGIQGRPSVSMTSAPKKLMPCLAAVDR